MLTLLFDEVMKSPALRIHLSVPSTSVHIARLTYLYASLINFMRHHGQLGPGKVPFRVYKEAVRKYANADLSLEKLTRVSGLLDPDPLAQTL